MENAKQNEIAGTPPLGSIANLGQFKSAVDARNRLTDLAVEYWAGLLGKKLDSSLDGLRGYGHGGWFGTGTFHRAIVPAAFMDVNTISFNSIEIDSNRNHQESTSQENDTFEAIDSGYIFTVSERTLKIIDARNPENLRLSSSIPVENDNVSFFVQGNRLIVVSTAYSRPNLQAAIDEKISEGFTEVKIYNIEDRSSPKEIYQSLIQGVNYSARLTEDRLVLVSSRTPSLPKPLFIPSVAQDARWNELTAQSLGTFESAEAYRARIAPQIVEWFLPDIVTINSGKTAWTDLGGWEDLQSGFMPIVHVPQTIIATLGLGKDIGWQDSEVVAGWNPQIVYQGNESLYLISNDWRIASEEPNVAEILKFELNRANGEVSLNATGSIVGAIRDSRMVSEYQGHLRVFSNRTVNSWNGGFAFESRQQANLDVLKPMDGKLISIGSLRDIADGQRIMAASFAGSKAFVTTAEFDDTTMLTGVDPLHGIDLSNPTNPKELSDVVIPGVSTHLQWVSERYLVGIGYVEESPNDWRWQVSLYDVQDIANPKVASRWVGENSIWPNGTGERQTPLAIHFDPESGVLVVPFAALGTGWLNPRLDIGENGEVDLNRSAFVFDLHLNQDAKIELLGTTDSQHMIFRAAILKGSLFALSSSELASYALDDLETRQDFIRLISPLVDDYATVALEQSIEIDPLANDHLVPPNAKIESLKLQTGRGTVKLSPDGKKVLYTAPKDMNPDRYSEEEVITYRVTLEDDRFYEATLRITLVPGLLTPDHFTAIGTTAIVVDPLANDVLPTGSKIVFVESFGQGSTVEIVEDGKRIRFQAGTSSTPFSSETLRYRVATPNGNKVESYINIQIENATTSSRGAVRLVTLGIDGVPTNQVKVGDEFWLELRAKHVDDKPSSVFAAYVDANIDWSMFEKVGEVVGLREFSTSVHGIRSAFGLQDFGSFSNSTLPGMVAKWPWHEFDSRLSRTEIRFSLPLPRKALEKIFWSMGSIVLSSAIASK